MYLSLRGLVSFIVLVFSLQVLRLKEPRTPRKVNAANNISLLAFGHISDGSDGD